MLCICSMAAVCRPCCSDPKSVLSPCLRQCNIRLPQCLGLVISVLVRENHGPRAWSNHRRCRRVGGRGVPARRSSSVTLPSHVLSAQSLLSMSSCHYTINICLPIYRFTISHCDERGPRAAAWNPTLSTLRLAAGCTYSPKGSPMGSVPI